MKKLFILIITSLAFLTSKKTNADSSSPLKQIDVYVAGSDGDASTSIAKVWKNGVATSFVNGSNYIKANSISISNSDVYMAGFEYNGATAVSNAQIYKNGVATKLINQKGFAVGNSVFVTVQ